MRIVRVLIAVLALVVVAKLVFVFMAWRSAIPEEDISAHSDFAPDLVEQGAKLAAVGNCTSCHTVPGGKSFAGGLPIPTPFGMVYSTNITPDPETGIGLWREAAFRRAMREGVNRAGQHLYPAFPYDHFTRVTDADNQALYAFLMTRQPVENTPPENDLPFPLNIRLVVEAWKLLYFDEGVFQPDASKGDAWNRGAYLVEGLGHCGACHTPRNSLGGEKQDARLGGGMAEGWNAYAINASSPAPVPWDAETIAFYLRHGWHELHGVSRGPMAEVTGNLGPLPDEDVDAIGVYVASLMGEPSADRKQAAEALVKAVASRNSDAPAPTSDSQTTPTPADPNGDGAAIYASTCAVCHESGRALPFGGLDFRLSTAVNAPNPQNIVNVALFGLPAADGEASAIMPGFAAVLSDDDVEALLNYMRGRFADKPAWNGVADMAHATRTGDFKVTIRPSDGIERAPENIGAED